VVEMMASRTVNDRLGLAALSFHPVLIFRKRQGQSQGQGSPALA